MCFVFKLVIPEMSNQFVQILANISIKFHFQNYVCKVLKTIQNSWKNRPFQQNFHKKWRWKQNQIQDESRFILGIGWKCF